MGVLAAGFARLILAALYLLVSSAASIIIARRLPQLDYGVYSVAAKRSTLAVRAFILLFDYWYRRAADAQGVAEFTSTLLLFTPIYYAIGLGLILAAGAPLRLAALYAVYAAAGGMALSLVGVYTAYRYVRSELLRILYRLVFAALVIILVYMLGFSSPGVAAAQAVATAVLVLLVAREVGVGRPRLDLLSWSRVRIPLLSAMLMLLSGLNMIVASSIIGPSLIAVYSIAVLAPSIIVEVGRQAASHTLPFIVKTGDTRSASRMYKVLLLAAAPILGYLAGHPLLTVSLLNPHYARTAAAYVIIASAVLAPLQLTALYAQMYTSAYGRETSETPRLRGYTIERLAVLTGLLAATPITLTLYPDRIAALISTLIAGYGVSLVTASRYAEGVERIAGYGSASIAAALATAYYTHTLYPDTLAPRFITALEKLAAGLPLLAPIYAALLLDPDLRLVAARLAQRAAEAPRMLRGALRRVTRGRVF